MRIALFLAAIVALVGAGCPPLPEPEDLCGNAELDGEEECDDGGVCDDGTPCLEARDCRGGDGTCVPRGGDGCTDSCDLEPGFTCAVAVGGCVEDRVCGDGVTASTEACDDGNQVDGDGCSAACVVEDGFVCSDGVCVSDACGDGLGDTGEDCDDDNNVDGDGCSAVCTTEDGFECTLAGLTAGFPSVCLPLSCFDGIVGAGEQCDDGMRCLDGTPCDVDGDCTNSVGDTRCAPRSGDGCSAACVVEPGFTCAGAPSVCELPNCGDGTLDTGEVCDDGDGDSGDGCSAGCDVEDDFTCVGTPSVCTRSGSLCGNNAIDAGETCDDGKQCSNGATCAVNASCAGVGDGLCAPRDNHDGCDATCHAQLCGDFNVDAGETCDDGKACSDGAFCLSDLDCFATVDRLCLPRSEDGCDDLCLVEPCGNSIVDAGEGCDDGKHCTDGARCDDDRACNNIGDERCRPRDGDGCNAACVVDDGFACSGAPSVCVASGCGDGAINGAEECDDGGRCADGGACTADGFCVGIGDGRCRPVSHDGCSAACVVEACGNGALDVGEVCDDRRQCSDGTLCAGDFACTGIGDAQCLPRDDDGCAADCISTEAGFACSGSPTVCVGGDCSPLNTTPDANLQSCSLVAADLIGADLSRANLRFANLNFASASSATLVGTDFTGATLTNADFSDSDLSGARIGGANLQGASFFRSNLTGVTGRPLNAAGATFFSATCPNGTNSDDGGSTCVGQGL